MTTQTLVVDNRVFLLGLDELYRDKMKLHEGDELLHAARAVCQALSVEPATGPVEGYYAEDELLTEYFQRMRALQGVPEAQRPLVDGLPEFRRLLEVCAAPLYGEPYSAGKLLPTGKDPLSKALEATFPAWTVEELVAATRDQVMGSDDFSLVGLAALTKDALLLAALRETVVLYAYMVPGCAAGPVTFVYEWAVDPMLAERANRFISCFNALFHETLPAAVPENAALYCNASDPAAVYGRCVRLGIDDATYPIRHYHWAVTLGLPGAEVRDFWSDELWTTDRFRQALREPSKLPFRI